MKKKYLVHVIYITIILALIVSLFIVINTKPNEMSDFEQYYHDKCISYTMENMNASEGQIVFVGDSLTDGYKLDEHYADLDSMVYNRGIGGDTTQGVLGRIDVSILDINPSKVVLLIGANDINAGQEVDSVVKNYSEIVSKIKNKLPETKLYCVSLLPQNDDIEMYGDFDAKKHVDAIMKVNEKIKEIVEENENTIYIDLFSLLKDENNMLIKEYSPDGLHLNEKGYDIWTSAVKEHLR